METRGKLPSQTEKNPNVNVVTLRNGKVTGESSSNRKSREDKEEIEIIRNDNLIVKCDEQKRCSKEDNSYCHSIINPFLTWNFKGKGRGEINLVHLSNGGGKHSLSAWNQGNS